MTRRNMIPHKPEDALEADNPELTFSYAQYLQIAKSTKLTDKDKAIVYNNLAIILLYGYGTPINAANDEKAYNYLSKAIELNIHQQSKFNLAYLLWFGWHVPKDKIEAKRMFTELGNKLEKFLNSITSQHLFKDSSRRDMLSRARSDILSSNFPRASSDILPSDFPPTPFDKLPEDCEFPNTWGSAGHGSTKDQARIERETALTFSCI